MGILDCDDAAGCCSCSFDRIGRCAVLIGMMHCCRLPVMVVMGRNILRTGEGGKVTDTRWYLKAYGALWRCGCPSRPLISRCLASPRASN